jgi:hypothetical protein
VDERNPPRKRAGTMNAPQCLQLPPLFEPSLNSNLSTPKTNTVGAMNIMALFLSYCHFDILHSISHLTSISAGTSQIDMKYFFLLPLLSLPCQPISSSSSLLEKLFHKINTACILFLHALRSSFYCSSALAISQHVLKRNTTQRKLAHDVSFLLRIFLDSATNQRSN